MPPLATTFAAFWQGYVTDPDAIEIALKQALASARKTYPGIALEEALVVRWIAERTPIECEACEALEELRVPELFLTCGCALRNTRAMVLFDVLFLTPAAEALMRCGQHPADVDDALQVLRERLFVSEGRIAQFSGRGALASWARVSLSRQLATLQRASERTIPLTEEDAPAPSTSSGPELTVTRRRYGHAFHAALKEALAELTDDQRTALRLHFVEGMSLESIAAALRVSRATAGRRVLEARNSLMTRVLALLGERLCASPSEIQSVLASMWTSLSDGVGQALGE